MAYARFPLSSPGDNVDCWMEIQDGKGPWASPVTGIVPLGSTLTMVVAINDPNGESESYRGTLRHSESVRVTLRRLEEYMVALGHLHPARDQLAE